MPQTDVYSAGLTVVAGPGSDNEVRVGSAGLTVVARPPSSARAKVVVYEVGRSETDYLVAWLQSLGWYVTKRDDSTLASATDLADFDLFIYFLPDINVSTDARAKAEAAGIPWAIYGARRWFEGEGTRATAPTNSNVSGNWEFVDNTPGVTKLNIVDNTHEITSSFPTGLLTIVTTAANSGAVGSGQSVIGDALADADDSHANYDTGQATLVAIEVGTDDLQGTPVATTERGLLWGLPERFDQLTDDGSTLFAAAFSWLMSTEPLKPTLVYVDPSTTWATLYSDAFRHADSEANHAASRWQITTAADTTFSSVVWDSNYTTDLLTISSPVGVLAYNTSYIARVLYRDNYGQDSRWSDTYAFDTGDLVAAGGAVVEFYTSGDSLISSLNVTVEDTDWTDVTLEDITIPATCAYILVSPYKDGSGTKIGYTRRMQVDLGAIPAAYHPFSFRPEAHTDETIHAQHATSAAATTADVDWSLGRIHTKTLNQAATTLTFSNVEPGRYVLILTQDTNPPRTVTWPSAVKWAGGTAPPLTNGSGASDVFGLDVVSGSLIIGYTLALNVS